ncbi:sodium/hydrogen exchanger [Methanohalobium evestigatum Z-7303]|uniref:Sodium/hydrogen exchanger n=1 Tax=Methanohalobium evestigatum (strain ATCC BAA-1072 / DSM 3721 / NBRC 107634 / OCM 161 / Z-7303) TaxID=644295 RepID=D7EAA3_METEZ|nr:cation:proton antiporter [Methanohalobium evestigatum]ADI74774.1 sodium/hydrogen exchanger [Methanohalobium evestigatum Z-7303]
MESVYFLQLAVIVLILALLAQQLGKIFKVPPILFLLAEGIIIGPEVLNIFDPNILGDGLTVLVSLSVAIIVFDGGLNLDLKYLRTIHKSTLKLSTIGLLITFILTTILTHLLLGIQLEMAALYGALMGATGPTVITPLVKNVKVNHKTSKVLELEGVFNDAASVILAAVIFEFIVFQLSGIEAIAGIFYRFIAGASMGVLSGFALSKFLSKGPFISPQTARLLTLTLVIGTYVISEMIGSESGVLAVALFGIIMGTSNVRYKMVLKEFKSDLVVMMLSLIFILLAALLKFDNIIQIGFTGIIIVLLLMFLIRPLSVFSTTIGSQLGRNDKLFISLIGPKGVVPASIATYFAIRLDALNIEGGQTLVGLVFLTVIITVFMTGTLSKPLANKLGVIPMEILIVGGGNVGQLLAKRLEKRGENVVVVDSSKEKCHELMNSGIRAVHGDVEDMNILKDAGIENAKYVVATTDKDNTNLLVCQVAKSKFGFNKDQVVARVNDVENLHAFWDLDIRSMSPAKTTAIVLDDMIGRPHMFSMCEVGGEGEILEIAVTNPNVVGKAVKDLALPRESLMLMVRRDDESIIAHGDLVLEYNDIVTVIGEGDSAKVVADMLEK